jgi:membrane-bound inhibitor of C-type lysozyme
MKLSFVVTMMQVEWVRKQREKQPWLSMASTSYHLRWETLTTTWQGVLNMAAKKRIVTQNTVTEADLNLTVSNITVLADAFPETFEKQFKSADLTVTSVTAVTVTASNDDACSGNQQDEAVVTSVTKGDEASLKDIAFSIEDLINEAIDPNEKPPIQVNAPKSNRPCY